MVSPGARHTGLTAALAVWVTLIAGPVKAQKVVSARAGLITYTQGTVFLDNQRVTLKSTRFPQMQPGQILSTARGRAELLLAPGAVLRLAESSQIRLDDTLLADTRATLQRGEALVEVLNLADGSRLRIEANGTTTEFARPGLYRFGIAQNETGPNTLRVYGGEAVIVSGTPLGPRTMRAKRGTEVELNPNLAAARFNRKQSDSLHAWAARRSFDLFMGDADVREKQTHWQATGGGYVENKNFGVAFRAFLRRPPPVASTPNVPRAEQH